MSLVLIVSASADRPTWEPVKAELESAAIRVVVFEADRVALGHQNFSATLRAPEIDFAVGSASFSAEDVAAAWWRKPHWLWLEHDDQLTGQSLEHEINRVQQSVWQALSPRVWLNDPDCMRSASSIHRQLLVAAELGFEVPTTVVSNGWKRFEELAHSGSIAVKALNGHIERESGRAKTVFTSRLNPTDIEDLASRSSSYPAVAQNFIQAVREWRVTVVGADVFSAAVYSTDSARVDWRRYQLTDKVRFEVESLPTDVSDRCVAVTKALGLRYAAIDLIERSDGEFVFLEANPNGQYAWLEMDLGLPISMSVARSLHSIATGRTVSV